MKLIPLTKNQFAIVDDEKYAGLSKHKWRAAFSQSIGTYYAVRTAIAGGKRITILMHREVLGLSPEDSRWGDHREPSQTLDNRHSNLRIASASQNAMNRRLGSRSSSGIKGFISIRDSRNGQLLFRWMGN